MAVKTAVSAQLTKPNYAQELYKQTLWTRPNTNFLENCSLVLSLNHNCIHLTLTLLTY